MKNIDGGVGGRSSLSDGSLFNSTDLMRRISDGMTSFNELAVSVPYSQIDLKSVYPISQYRDTITATSGSVTQADGEFLVTTDADGTGDVLFRSVARGRYVAGLDAVAGIGIRFPQAPTGDQTIEWGYTDFQNGFVTGYDADGLYTAVYRGGIRGSIHRREDWTNPMADGDFVLRPERLNVYRMSFRWYGRGPFALKIAGERDGIGQIIAADTTLLDDASGPITNNPNQPMSVRVTNNGTASALPCYVAGRQFFVLGDYNPMKRITSNSRLDQSVGTTFTPLVSFRQKTGIVSSINANLGGVSIIASGSNLLWQVRAFTSLTGASFTAPPNSNSGVETAMDFDVSATAMTGGITLYEGLVAGGRGNDSGKTAAELPGLELPRDGDIITLCARAESGTAAVTSVFRVIEEW